MSKTTCIKCHRDCQDYELDINYECPICQMIFANKMKARKGRTLYKKSKTYAGHIHPSIQLAILKTAVKVYKIKFKGKDQMIKYINDLHDTNLTRHVFDELSSGANLRKHNLQWDYKKT